MKDWYWTRIPWREWGVTLVVTPEGLDAVLFDREAQAREWPPERALPLSDYRRPFEAYFSGRPVSWNIPLTSRGTAFQRRVWTALQGVPPGTVLSYGALAARLGRPEAVRAVARAVAANPWPIVIPCHRVVGSAGQLVGYQGGLRLKAALLALEGAPAMHPQGHARFQF
ncbi:MAG: methylated-DNA--[protein]-cysteine S-methyltransferase [Firmicutes bacterium]|nr:methylated-DNA--[protein]-cysteine S-methyltransferase [Bacillota bacterium]